MSTHPDKLATRRTTVEPSWVFKLVAAIRDWTAAFIIWRAERAARAALNSMSDYQLKDIGLTRSDIRGAVHALATTGDTEVKASRSAKC